MPESPARADKRQSPQTAGFSLQMSSQAMSAQLQSLVESQKAMRVAREQRLAQMEVANEEARAEYMVQKVLRQQV